MLGIITCILHNWILNLTILYTQFNFGLALQTFGLVTSSNNLPEGQPHLFILVSPCSALVIYVHKGKVCVIFTYLEIVVNVLSLYKTPNKNMYVRMYVVAHQARDFLCF